VRTSVTIDWTLRESARAKIQVIVKRILNNSAIRRISRKKREDVLKQAELLRGTGVGECLRVRFRLLESSSPTAAACRIGPGWLSLLGLRPRSLNTAPGIADALLAGRYP